jgi:hypothetical protein
MAFIAIPNAVLVRLFVKTAVAELKASISLYFTRDEFDDSDMDDLLADLESGFATTLMDALCDDYNAYLLEAWDMRSVDGYKATRNIDIDGGSGAPETPCSPALCCVVSFHGNKRGKWNAGRNYVAGLSEDDVDQVDIQQGTQDAILQAYTNLIDTPPSGWLWVVASRYKDKAPRTVGVTTPVTGALVRSGRFGLQRRRAQRP